jgi:D-alanyl-D-alanine carboxypeptidase/D-alanyl-D-alanine-endopeptidase (penicillin-binding protein 4)
MKITRRFLLGGAMAGAARAAFGQAPDRSPWPEPRPALQRAGAPLSAPATEDLIAAARLGGDVTYVVADARTGQVLEERRGTVAMPPASTAKAITTLYALERLGPAHRFATRLIATGPVAGGVLKGDLVLAGGGDPTLHTDHLTDMAKALRAAGVSSIAGRFLVWGGALPYAPQIAADQPVHVGYNPAVSGVNLNYNRVFFEWKPAGGSFELTMDARSEKVVPRVRSARVSIVDRDTPVFTHAERDGHEEWTVARSALGKGGGRWLPVRRPEAYAADVFQTLARAQGIALPIPEQVAQMPGGTVLVEHASDELKVLLREMLRYSTNITAEAVGMSASGTHSSDAIAGSGRAMNSWLAAHGVPGTGFSCHSGLGADSRISAADMVAALAKLGPGAGLRTLLRPFAIPETLAPKAAGGALKVDAKTGTLNFVSTLTGYITAPGGAELVFAIFTGDVARRAAAGQAESPPGSTAWIRRSKTLQQQLVARWGKLYRA